MIGHCIQYYRFIAVCFVNMSAWWISPKNLALTSQDKTITLPLNFLIVMFNHYNYRQLSPIIDAVLSAWFLVIEYFRLAELSISNSLGLSQKSGNMLLANYTNNRKPDLWEYFLSVKIVLTLIIQSVSESHHIVSDELFWTNVERLSPIRR